MIRTTWTLCLTLFLTTSVSVAAFPPLTSAGEPIADEMPRALTLADDLLLLRLPDDLDGEFALDVSYLVQGEQIFAERLRGAIPPADAGPDRPKVISLLAWHPSVAAKLDEVKNTGASVIIAWALDRETSGEQTLGDLTLATRDLQLQGPLFAQHASTVMDTGAFETTPPLNLSEPALATKGTFSTDPACILDCNDDHDWCYYDCAASAGPPGQCEARCDFDYEWCVDACPVLCTGPSSRDYSVTSIVGFTYFGQSRCLYDPLNSPYQYDFGRVTYQTIHYRETTQCDGSKSTTVLSTNYWSRDCYLKTSSVCGTPSGSWTQYSIC